MTGSSSSVSEELESSSVVEELDPSSVSELEGLDPAGDSGFKEVGSATGQGSLLATSSAWGRLPSAPGLRPLPSPSSEADCWDRKSFRRLDKVWNRSLAGTSAMVKFRDLDTMCCCQELDAN